MSLTEKEQFTAEIIKNYFSKKYSNVKYFQGEDPPDIYLKYSSNKVGIELTTLHPNLYKDRMSIDECYKGVIKNIDIKIPDYTNYLVVFHHANIRPNKALRKKIKDFLVKPNSEMKKCIDGVLVEIHAGSTKQKIGTISVMSLNDNRCNKDFNKASEFQADSNIEHVFKSILSKTVTTKKEKCKKIKNPIWLAMYAFYPSLFYELSKDDNIELYKKTIKNIDFGIFEKIIIAFSHKREEEIIVFDRKVT